MICLCYFSMLWFYSFSHPRLALKFFLLPSPLLPTLWILPAVDHVQLYCSSLYYFPCPYHHSLFAGDRCYMEGVTVIIWKRGINKIIEWLHLENRSTHLLQLGIAIAADCRPLYIGNLPLFIGAWCCVEGRADIRWHGDMNKIMTW